MPGNIYEMLWDCPSCGSKKLLGKTHRFCPNCGSPQDASKRYFPSDAEKILAKDSEYFGADRVCAYCKNATGAKAKFCAACGAPLEGTAEVPRIGAAAPPASPAPASKGRKWLWVSASAGAAALAFIAVFLSWTKPVSLVVGSHSWTREIRVERFQEVREEAWCDSMPHDARSVSRTRRVRSHRQVHDGEDCRTVRRDRGDGTFAEEEQCSPRLRKEPVYDDECRYAVDRWAHVRSEKKSGSLPMAPSWPEVRPARAGNCLGCEREGARSELHDVRFRAGDKELSCTLKGGGEWEAFQPGSRWEGRVRALTGGLDCGSLKAGRS